jgi:RimJ/RimL family protein N-acetyltransferase
MAAQYIDSLLGIFGDPKVMASFSEEPFTLGQMRHWLDRNLRHQDEYGYGLFSVIRKADGLLIGDCGLEQMEVEGRLAAELGYDFRSDAWNRGFERYGARYWRYELTREERESASKWPS